MFEIKSTNHVCLLIDAGTFAVCSQFTQRLSLKILFDRRVVFIPRHFYQPPKCESIDCRLSDRTLPPEPLFIVQGTNCFTGHRLRPSKLKLNKPMLATKRMLKTPAVDVPDMAYPIFPEPNFIVTNFVPFNIDVCCFITEWNGAEQQDYYGVGHFWRQELRLIIGFRVLVGKEDWLTEDSCKLWNRSWYRATRNVHTTSCGLASATVALKDVEANVLLKSAEITDFHLQNFCWHLAPAIHTHAQTATQGAQTE